MGNGTTPTKVEIPNIKLTISMDDWKDWENRYNFKKGIKRTSGEMTGSIT